jgi:hypothetical protein
MQIFCSFWTGVSNLIFGKIFGFFSGKFRTSKQGFCTEKFLTAGIPDFRESQKSENFRLTHCLS